MMRQPHLVKGRSPYPPKSQAVIGTGLRIRIPRGLHGELSSLGYPRPGLPTVAAHLVPRELTDELSVLVSNPHKIPLSINWNAGIAFLKIVSNKDVISAYSIGSLSDLGLPTPEDSSVIASILKDEQIGNITPTKKEQFLQLVHKYKHLFAETNTELGYAHNCFHKVDTGDAPPLFQTAYRRSPVANKIIQQEIDALLDGGLIVPSNSPWASPLLLIKKKDGSNRVVIDYWKLNAISKKDRYPLPRIDDTLDKLGGAKFFSAMDLIAVTGKSPCKWKTKKSVQ